MQQGGVHRDLGHGAFELRHAAVNGLLVEHLEFLPRIRQAGADDGIEGGPVAGLLVDQPVELPDGLLALAQDVRVYAFIGRGLEQLAQRRRSGHHVYDGQGVLVEERPQDAAG